MITSNISNTTTSNTYTLSNASNTTTATTATINYNGNFGTTTIGTDYIYNTNWQDYATTVSGYGTRDYIEDLVKEY